MKQRQLSRERVLAKRRKHGKNLTVLQRLASQSVCLSACLPDCLSVFLPVGLCVCLPTSVSISLSACRFVCLSVCLSACLPDCPSVFLPVGLCVCLSVCLPVVCMSDSNNEGLRNQLLNPSCLHVCNRCVSSYITGPQVALSKGKSLSVPGPSSVRSGRIKSAGRLRSYSTTEVCTYVYHV